MLELPNLSSLSDEHVEVLKKPFSSSFLVVGPPGTGKSIMAIYRTRLLARSGRQAVLIMYGRVLSDYTKAAVKSAGIPGIVYTYHKWFPQFWKRCYGVQPPKVSQWVFDWSECLKRIIVDPPPVSEKRHIVIDEGQDMPKEFYVLMRWISESLTIFADDNQRITERQSTIPEIRAATGIEDTVSLAVNHRNTREIAEFSATFYTGLPSGIPALPARHGQRPFLQPFIKLHQEVDYIAAYENAHPKVSIGVLVNRSDEVIKFYNRLEKKTANPVEFYSNMQSGSSKARSNPVEFQNPGIKIMAYPSAKGLEFDTVFLPELQSVMSDPGSDGIRMKFYVMTSRAKNTLGLMYTGDSAPPFVSALPMDLIETRGAADRAESANSPSRCATPTPQPARSQQVDRAGQRATLR